MRANIYALIAIALWAVLAALGLALKHVPPFLLTGIALCIGSVLAWPAVLRDPRQWRLAPSMLSMGVASFFGFHFLLFMSLRMAPTVEVNLVNYLWPLFIVVLAPLYLPGVQLRGTHILAALIGFAGAALAIVGGGDAAAGAPGLSWDKLFSRVGLGYLMALGSALVWANFSLQTKRAEHTGKSFPTAAIGLFGLIGGALSLLCHWALEPAVALSAHDGFMLALLGLGPLGAGFFLWDKALKLGDARHIGILSYLTPLSSTAVLVWVSGRPFTLTIALAAALIVGAAVLGTRAK